MTVGLSLVVPVYNEEALIRETLGRVRAQLEATGLTFEIVCVDDGSTDDTADIIDEASRADERVVALHFARNFGKEAALCAGLDAARGDAVILIDADLQHPPELIGRMVELWREGHDIVEAEKADRGRESLAYRLFAKLFYALMGRVGGANLRRASDFKLLDRQAVEALKALPEKARFFRGLVGWIGFRRAAVRFDVPERKAGRSGWSSAKLVRYAASNIISFTTLPLYLTAWVGLVTTLLGVLLGAQTLYNFVAGNAVNGFTTVILLVIFFSGIILSAIGAVAVYLAKVLEEVKGRPLYIVRKRRDRR
ncbi:MAG: glycosyltransferase family 2 protein [Deltaproteobacteria bacterium]|nr:glycosyltransferase family 2 protein [Deltaproteobacteria bacterium]